MRNVKVVTMVIMLSCLSGCAATVFNPFSDGQIAIMGDREGIEAYEDSQLGLVSEGDNQSGESSYFKLRESQSPKPLKIMRGKGNAS